MINIQNHCFSNDETMKIVVKKYKNKVDCFSLIKITKLLPYFLFVLLFFVTRVTCSRYFQCALNKSRSYVIVCKLYKRGQPRALKKLGMRDSVTTNGIGRA